MPALRVWLDLVVAAVAPAALLGATGVLEPPATVARLTIANPTDYDLAVAVGRPGDDDVVRLFTVIHGHTSSTAHVPDQGDDWRIELRSQGVAAARQLAEQGAPPSA